MDYNKLTRRLRDYAEQYKSGSTLGRAIVGTEDVMFDAADAIEALLAERDALMKDAIRCETCLHVKECCFNELRRIDCAQSNRGHWQWRGPQKGGCV